MTSTDPDDDLATAYDGDPAEAEITDEDLDAAEDDVADDEACRESDDLGVFDPKDYAARIADWTFKTADLYVHGDEIVGYYRRPRDAPGGSKWERIGHSRQANALDLRRLIDCARERDEDEDRRRLRREALESLFGPGAERMVDSLLAMRAGGAARDDAEPAGEERGATLTPRQEAFCRNFLTEPNATRAAILAGYGEAGAAVEGHRLLRNAKILARIAMLRRVRGLTYRFDRDSVLDRLEWVFGEAMEGRAYHTAVRALLAQAHVFGIANKRHAGTERAEAEARAEIGAAGAAPGDDAPS